MERLDTGALTARTARMLEHLAGAAGKRALAETESRLREAARRLADGRIVVVVCGEFNRGKSSLVNALVERKGLLPVDVLQTTSVVTTVGWGPRAQATARLRDTGGETEERAIPLDEIAQYVTESSNPGNRHRAELIEVLLPHPKLADGVTLVDTPGVGGVFPEHTAMTTGFLASADAVVFVADMTSPLTASELRFLGHAVTATGSGPEEDGLLVVLTRADQAAPADRREMLANTRAKLAELTGRPTGDTSVLPVSTRLRLRHLASVSDAPDEDSGYPLFEAVLWRGLRRRRARLLLARPLEEAGAAVQALLRPLAAEQEALARETDETLSRMRAEAEAGQRRITELRSTGAQWRTELRSLLKELRRDLVMSLHDELDTVWQRVCTEYLYDEALQDDTDELAAQVSAAYTAVAGATARRAETELNALVAGFARRHGIGLSPTANSRIDAVGPLRLEPDLGTEEQPGKVMPIGRDGAFGASMGAAIGGTVFGPVGALIGSAAGLLVGLLRGVKAARHQELQTRRRNLRDQLGMARGRQQRVIVHGLGNLLDTAAERAEQELDSLLRQQTETVGDTLERLKATADATREQARARHEALAREHSELLTAGQEVATLAALVSEVVTEADTDLPHPSRGAGHEEAGDEDAGDEEAGHEEASDEGPGATAVTEPGTMGPEPGAGRDAEPGTTGPEPGTGRDAEPGPTSETASESGPEA
ncbi:dynamin family protein [Streptomyces sp. NPDC050546]|uniref:dynamin family protein n=1 Tax=Streptomyces sp. NPDC050546 TaxID=3365628 RepID=UPI00378D966B